MSDQNQNPENYAAIFIDAIMLQLRERLRIHVTPGAQGDDAIFHVCLFDEKTKQAWGHQKLRISSSPISAPIRTHVGG